MRVNGDGTLAFRGYHNAYGYAEISAQITAAQHVELNPGSEGLTLTWTIRATSTP